MTRIWMVNGSWYDIDADADELGQWINDNLNTGFAICEVPGWMQYDRNGDKQRRPEEDRLIINLNHVTRVDPS